MMIGRTRLSVGPLRDLEQLDATIARIGRIPGVAGVAVDAFVDRRALLGLQVLRPVDLAAELRRALGADLDSCTVGADRLEVVLRSCGRALEEVLGEVLDPAWGGEPAARPADGASSATSPEWGTHRVVVEADWADPAGSPWSHDDDRWAAPEPPVGGRGRRVAPPALADALFGAASDPFGVVAPGPAASDRTGQPGPATEQRAGRREADRPPSAADLLEDSFAHAPIATALIAPDGRWLRVNRRLCELLGRDEATLLRGGLQELTHPDDVTVDHQLGRETLAGVRDRYAVDKRWLHADGRTVPTRLEVSLVRDADGLPRWFVFQVVDLTPPATVAPRALIGTHAA